MASLFSGRASLGGSKRETTPPPPTAYIATLPSPFAADLATTLSFSDLHETAYEILVASCRTSSGKPLSSLTNAASVNSLSSPSPSPSSAGGGTPPLQRSLTSAAASKMKKALGLRSSTSSLGLKRGGSRPKADGSPMSKPLTVGELLRVQMRVPETVDSRIRRAFLRVAASQMMEKADSSRRATKNQPNPLPVLAILAKDVGELATQEKRVFSPILKRWHPLAAGVAVATLHACYGNELKQFISGISELTPDAVRVLRAADKLEQDLVQTAVEDSVDSEDGGKGVIREMPPYEAETVIANLVKIWIKTRVDKLKVSVDLNLQQEAWNPNSSQEGLAPSAVEVLRLVDETLDAYFQLPIPMHPMLLPDLVTGLDRCLQYYATKARSGCGTRNTFVPGIPALTRCSIGKKLGVFKKKDKSVNSQKRSSLIATNGDGSFSAPQLCLRINTLQKIRTELEVVEKRIITHLRNSETATEEDFSNGLAKKFEATPSVCVEGIQQLSEALAYRTVFHDLSHALWDGLYVGEMSSSRIEPFIQELEKSLLIISDTVNERARTRVITDIMKASFDGFLLVLLAGGPSRAFTKPDSQIMEDDFQSLKDLFWANGDGLSADLINKYSSTARDIMPLFKTDTESIIERLRRTTLEASGSSGRSRQPVPPTSGQWSPNEPNTLLRVLCYRNDEAATKFLKKTYNLPKKL